MSKYKEEGALVAEVKRNLTDHLENYCQPGYNHSARYVATGLTPPVLAMVREAHEAGRQEVYDVAVKLSDGDRLGTVDVKAFLDALKGGTSDVQ